MRDFNPQDPGEPEGLGRRTFLARPRADGLWLKLTFRDGEELEGLAGADLGFLDAAMGDRGVFLAPPDARANTQRVFVPRQALSGLEVLGVIRPSAPKPKARMEQEPQPGLFGDV